VARNEQLNALAARVAGRVSTPVKKIGIESIFRYSRLICLIAEITVSVFYPVYVGYWLASGIVVSVFYLYTQWAAASGRLGRVTQDTYYRNTTGSGWHVAVVCIAACMLAPPVWLAALVSRHIRSARRLREQRQRGEPVAVTESHAWAKAIEDE
jgi:hypothetical protein